MQKGLVPAALQCYQTALAVNPNLVRACVLACSPVFMRLTVCKTWQQQQHSQLFPAGLSCMCTARGCWRFQVGTSSISWLCRKAIVGCCCGRRQGLAGFCPLGTSGCNFYALLLLTCCCHGLLLTAECAWALHNSAYLTSLQQGLSKGFLGARGLVQGL